MTDNVTANAGSGGAKFRTLDDGSEHWPASIISYVVSGSDGAWVNQTVDTTHGLPVAVVGTVPVSGTFWQTTQPVSAASLPLPTGAATAANQATEISALSSIASSLGGTLIVSGTVSVTGVATAAKQDTGNTSLASIDGKITACNTGAVVVSSGTLTANLGTLNGAATAAKQPALGTAGSASTDVISVQGIASMTPLLVNGSGVTQPVSIASAVTVAQATASSLNATVVGTGTFLVQAAQSGTWTTTVTQATGTNLHTVVDSGTVIANIGTTNGLALDATLTGGTQKTLLYDGTNTIGTAAHPVQVSLANTAANGTAVKVDGSAVTQPISAASLPLPTGAATSAKQPALGTAGTASNDVITVQGIASMTALKVDGSATTQPVQIKTATSGGASVSSLISASGTNATVAKASAGTLYGIQVGNVNAAARFLHLYDTASSPTVGTTTVLATFVIPGNTAGAGSNIVLPPQGMAFSTGIAFSITSGMATTDTGAIGAGDVCVNLEYA